MSVALRMTATQHQQLEAHLFPGDGREAVALMLCGRRSGGTRQILVARRIVPVPHAACTRTPVSVDWPTDLLPELLNELDRMGGALIKVHSHPIGIESFSDTDTIADRKLFPSVFGWVGGDGPHASAVMLPGGSMFARAVDVDGTFRDLSTITIVGDDLRVFDSVHELLPVPEFARRHGQLFGAGTTARLSRLSVAVVGASGTGSPVAEMLVRLGVGEIVLVDPDRIEEKNVNRIYMSHVSDARAGRFKVDVIEEEIARIGLGTRVTALPFELGRPDVVRRVAETDFVFGCMDGHTGRQLLNRLATYYILPYIDVGIRLEADGQGGIDQVCGGVHYVKPGGSSLMSRGVVTQARLQSEALKKSDPEAYATQLEAKYIIGVDEERPAVIGVNTLFASLAVNEFLARIHPFRDDSNAAIARQMLSLTQGAWHRDADGEPDAGLARKVGIGDVMPLLDSPGLSEMRQITKYSKAAAC